MVAKENNIDATGFVLKTTYDTDKSDLEKKIRDADKKIPDISNLAKKTDLNAKITEIEGKIPSITGLATNSALTVVENKIHGVSSLVKNTDYNTKISEVENKVNNHNHNKYITIQALTNLEAKALRTILAQQNLVKKTDFNAKLQELNKEINSNKITHLLAETELTELENVDAKFEAKFILMMMAINIILYFNQCTNILMRWALKLLHGNQKDCLMKKLVLLQTLAGQFPK